MSNEFTSSYIFTDSNFFTPTPTQSIKGHKLIKTISLTETLTVVKTVIFSSAYLASYIFYECTNESDTVTLCATLTYLNKMLPYVIYSYKPTIYIYPILNDVIEKKKKITEEKLIGISCGAAAVFFLIVYVIVFIIQKKNGNLYNDSNDDYSNGYITDENYEREGVHDSNNNKGCIKSIGDRKSVV